MTNVRKMSVAEAKARFSEVVAEARRGKKILILRHGEPAAAVVPASAVERTRPPVTMNRDEALAVFESFAHLGDPVIDAVADLRAGRG
jgi:prevent-host-death family protein